MRLTTGVSLLSGILALAMSVTPAGAAIILNTGDYSENFDDRIATTTTVSGAFSSTAGVQSPIPAGGSGSSGWDGAKIAGTSPANMNFVVDNGIGTGGGLYSFGSTPNGSAAPDLERALGAVASTTNIAAFGVEIINNTGATRHTADISYTGEFWRSSTSASNTLTFGYSVGPAGSTNYLTGAATGLASLNLVGPAPVAANGPLNGDLAGNQSLRSGTLTNLNWQVGQSLYLRWHDVNNSGNDAGLAVDNFRLAIPEPTSVALMLLAGLGCVGCVRREIVR
jgi:hypothetical protein